MTTNYGFELLREEDILELNTHVRLLRHVKTGAELLSLENDDENKVFGISFRTPPTDSTGVPHIMEHAVLSGSRKYPLKEPFVELLKGSLKTFLNAMTFPDKTCYPVASTNLQDFYNLVDVYLDAVFYPLIPPETLQQEGWHYELEDLDAPLTYKGVVFNEMKGVYSSPESLLGRYSQASLFPNNTYGVDSGGDPTVIPDLTYEQFKSFHETYYHPSNARIYFYGDDDPERRLELLAAYLDDYEKIEFDSDVTLQPYFDQPKRFTFPYDAGPESEDSKKAMFTMSWLLTESFDQEVALAFHILSYILISTTASPLRKALIDSGLGEGLIGSGVQGQLRQMAFSAGLKGVAPEDVDKAEALILETLTQLVDDGIEPDMIEAAINTIEFRMRENNTGSYPRGLVYMFGSLTNWLHDRDPIAPLAYEAPLAAVKAKMAQNKTFFEDLIQTHLLDNSHRITVILEPDPELNQRLEAAEKERLAQIRATMNQAELQAVIDNARLLKIRQETPDPPEALARVPRLALTDLDAESKTIPQEISEVEGSQIFYHDLFTNGIVYLNLGFNMHALPQALLPYMNLFSDGMTQMGTETESFVKLSQRIGRKTGGISASAFTSAVKNSPESTAWLLLSGKSTMAQTDDLLAIMHDILLTGKLDDQERFRQLLLEAKAGQESGLIPGGHGVVNRRLNAKFSESGWVNEQMGGLEQLFFLRRLLNTVENDWPSVLEKLEEIRKRLLNRNTMFCNITLDQDNWTEFQPKLNNFLSGLPAAPANLQKWSPTFNNEAEGLTIPAQVNYVGKGANLYELGYELDGSIMVITNYLRTTWLWEKIRAQGGAYGGFCLFNSNSGLFSFLSYRDPNLLGSLDNYDQTSHFLRELDLNEDELTKSIIGAIGQIDAYQLPDAKGFTALTRHLTGVTDEYRQQMRDQVLNTSADEFRALAMAMQELSQKGQVVVLGSQEAIQQANAEKDNFMKVTKVL